MMNFKALRDDYVTNYKLQNDELKAEICEKLQHMQIVNRLLMRE